MQAIPQLSDRSKLPKIVDPAIRDTMDLKHLYQVCSLLYSCSISCCFFQAILSCSWIQTGCCCSCVMCTVRTELSTVSYRCSTFPHSSRTSRAWRVTKNYWTSASESAFIDLLNNGRNWIHCLVQSHTTRVERKTVLFRVVEMQILVLQDSSFFLLLDQMLSFEDLQMKLCVIGRRQQALLHS